MTGLARTASRPPRHRLLAPSVMRAGLALRSERETTIYVETGAPQALRPLAPRRTDLARLAGRGA